MSIIQPQTATERATLIALRLAAGEKLRTTDVAALCGITRQGAYRLLEGMSRAGPLLLDNGEWQLLRDE
jgi:DNA-binding IclR family transcriptional regulator